MPGRFSFKKKVLRVRSQSPDFGFVYGGGYKNERSYSSASDSTNSMSDSDYSQPINQQQALNHPIVGMQGPFLESMRFPDVDVENCINPKGYDLKYHPLVKVIAQIAYGMHLLHKRITKAETEVVRILQKHVDDVNKFLNKSTRNFDLAIADIEERHKNLKTAIDNASVFEKMLATDEPFRSQISEGNKTVENVVKRTEARMQKNLRDVYEGMRGLGELHKYMNSIKKGWKNTGLVRTYGVMTSNVEVWGRCFETLRKAGVNLSVSLEKLKHVVGQVDKKVKKAGKAGLRGRKTSFGSQITGEKVLKHARSMPGLPHIPKRTSSLRIRESALAPLGLHSMFLPDSEEDISPSSRSPKPNLRIRCDNARYPGSIKIEQPKTTFFNVDESDSEEPDSQSPVTVTSLTPRPMRDPNQWKPLPPTPVSPPADALIDSFPRPHTAVSLSEMKPKKIGQDDDNSSPLTIELCLEESLDDNTSMFQLRPIYGEHGLSHSRSASPLPVIRPLAIRAASIAV